MRKPKKAEHYPKQIFIVNGGAYGLLAVESIDDFVDPRDQVAIYELVGVKKLKVTRTLED